MASTFLPDLDTSSIIPFLPYVLVSALIFLISYQGLLKRKPFDAKCPPVTTTNWPIVGDLGFWRQRHEWWNTAMKHSSSKNFSFHIGKHRLVGTNSSEGRKMFFESKEMGFAEG
jgi:cellulose synthase/poly-beta-1,6-N-acetylglucosamine synthase-like glycosyltransferase